MSELPINQVVTGDCREVMAKWPSECIDFVQFSPPYWGLRDYGEEAESVWGGDESCNHVWSSYKQKPQGGLNREDNPPRVGANKTTQETCIRGDGYESNFCQKCGAWRGQLGLEPDYRMYVQHLVEIGREIKRILKPSGSWYLNLGDTYAGSGGSVGHTPETKNLGRKTFEYGAFPTATIARDIDIPAKCKMLMPYRVALALIKDGWICRNDIVWLKPNPMPSSVKDRLNTTTERIFHFVKNKQYYYDLDAIREPHKTSRKDLIRRINADRNGKTDTKKNVDKLLGGPQFSTEGEDYSYSKLNSGKNPGDVIEQTTQPFPEAHFAVYPPDLCELPIKSSCPPKVCLECGKPYERTMEIVENENTKIPERWGANSKGEYHGMGKEDEKGKAQAPSNLKRNIIKSQKKQVEFKGWKKTCNCSAAKTKPGIVLDPMCGAGSTLVKAKQLGRRYIGIEISEEYADITRERLRKGDEEYKRWKRKERRLKREAEGTANLEEFV